MKLIERIVERHGQLAGWRQDIHAHPELGFQEERTAALVAERLASFGCEVQTGIGGTGVVGTLEAGSDSGTIGLRADMDALPIQEANTFDHRSTYDGRMHACGHDGHTTMLLGAAQYLAETRQFNGRAHFVFQPAEEGLGGAKAMVDDGLFQRFPMDMIFGMHNQPGLETGRFSIRPGPMMAGGGFFDITLTGRGAHGAHPESSADPIVAAAQIVSALQSVVARNVDPQDTAVLSVTRLLSGDAYNVIPNGATLGGTVRAFQPDTLEFVDKRIGEVTRHIAEGLGVTADYRFQLIFPPLINEENATRLAGDVAAAIVSETHLDRNGPGIMASEDFSYMLNECPGAYINIGNGGEEGYCEVHNPGYDFNDEIIPLGATFFARLVESRLNA
ncbi:MAG: M20 aminoacylase family protein [Pseudomonadota bacterium]|nr:M20 aminoacylase family protein [Pseudomonadota bacterium]